ncbi:MAG TPA: nicotinate phosphoribosyltransferase [Mycobacteriales bacterium]
MTTAALLTDRYELTMLDGLIAASRHEQPAVFSSFARRLPRGRRYGVVAGTGRLVPMVADLRFDDAAVDWLRREDVVSAQTGEFLRGFRFSGDVEGYAEGEPYVAGSPLLTVRGPLGECLVLETLVLSVLNHDSAVAAAAARMHCAARGRPLIEMGARRTHEQAGVDAARAAWLCGFDATSDLEAGARYGIPTTGTAAHAFVLAFPTEADAFAAQIRTQGLGTTLLVDTYDIDEGIRTAVRVAGPGLDAIRIDSGPAAEGARRARALLDSLGATSTRIVLTGDLDEFVITELAGAPADAYGVGTQLSTGSGRPTAGLVYKLVETGGHPVAKLSEGKADPGGARRAWRRTVDGRATEEVVLPDGAEPPAGPGTLRPLTVPYLTGGEPVALPTLAESRAHHLRARAELPADALLVAGGPEALPLVPPL